MTFSSQRCACSTGMKGADSGTVEKDQPNLWKKNTGSPHFVRFALCVRFRFPPKKFTLCDFLPFPHFVRTFYVIFEEFFDWSYNFFLNVDFNRLGNNFVIFTRFWVHFWGQKRPNQGSELVDIKKFRFVSLCANFTLCDFSKKIKIAQCEGYLYMKYLKLRNS